MSGGSWDYAFERVEETVNRLRHSEDASRRALGNSLAKLPAALKAIEWVDSSDHGPEEEEVALAACFRAMGSDITLERLAERLRTAEVELAAARSELDAMVRP